METPTNPLLDVLDIAALSGLAREHGMSPAVDNTFATPYLQRPLELGADLVVHSTTKYASGHSDVVSGAVIARRSELLEGIRFLQNAMGAVPGPLDCYLVQRGLKTLAVRMDRHCANAQALAESLVGTEGIRRVIYPGLDSHPGHAIAARQMRRVTADVMPPGHSSVGDAVFEPDPRVFSHSTRARSVSTAITVSALAPKNPSVRKPR